MINIIICFLLIINLFLIYKINKKKIKKYFLKSQIPSVGIEELDDLFIILHQQIIQKNKNLKN